MNVPDNLKYSKEHEWVKVEGGEAVVGITDFAQHELTEIVFVELPALGKQIEQGAVLCVVESVKAVSEVYSPLAGTVKAVNDALEDEPERVNNSPYEDGWMVRLEMSDASQLDALMDAAAYKQFIQDKD